MKRCEATSVAKIRVRQNLRKEPVNQGIQLYDRHGAFLSRLGGTAPLSGKKLLLRAHYSITRATLLWPAFGVSMGLEPACKPAFLAVWAALVSRSFSPRHYFAGARLAV